MSGRVLLWGGRSQARIAGHMAVAAGYQIGAIFDATLARPDFPSDAPFAGKPEELAALARDCSHFVVCIGGEHGYARSRFSAFCEETLGLAPLTLIHPTAYVSEAAKVGRGLQAMPHGVIHHFTEVGDWCLLNSTALVEHECIVGHGVHLMGGATVAGLVRIGDFASICFNAVIHARVTIGEGAVIGPGAVLMGDAEPGAVYEGAPAVKTRAAKRSFDQTILDRVASGL